MTYRRRTAYRLRDRTGTPTLPDQPVARGARTRRRRLVLAGLGLLGIESTSLPTTPAAAATATNTFAVTATVQATCTIAANPLAFGTYTGVLIHVNTTVSATCTNTTPYNIGLSAGLTGASVTTRVMTQSANTLAYSLFRDAAWTLNWGVTVSTDTVAGTGNGAAQPITVYGQIAAGLYVTPGAYTDTITATVTF
jgi:spore coat protein U-like protein